MHLNDLKPAWQQLKLMSSLDHQESNVILAILENAEEKNKARSHKVLLNTFMFIIITLFCQADEFIHHLGY